jgi:hypothetical protein
MSTTDRVTKSIEVGNFDQIRLQVNNVENEVEIKQGQLESLAIEANPDLLSRIKTAVLNGQLNIQMGGSWSDKIRAALATSLGRPRIRYVVTVRNLTGLDLFGLVHARVDNVETEWLQVKFGGVGGLQMAGLNAKRLDVTVAMPSPCKIEVSGRAGEQHVSLNGMSEYDAHGLESRKTTVVLRGPGGHAVVRAKDELAITIGGPGSVEYYGHPRMTKKVSPLGVVAHRSGVQA